MFNSILTWKNNHSDNVSICSNRSDITSSENNNNSSYRWDDWASRSGIHYKLPANHKAYLDRLINKLEKEVYN
jgi:hypothetical protein